MTYIDLDQLFAGEVVSFKIPSSEWMAKKCWIADHEKSYMFYVEQFEMYLPIKPKDSIHSQIPFKTVSFIQVELNML